MRSIATVPLFVSLLALAGCGVVEPVVCTDVLVSGVFVTVVDSTTSEPISDATVVVEDGDYRETIEDPPQGEVGAAHERPGTYRIEVTSPGYVAWVREGIRVTAGECHVRTEEVTARLQRAEGSDAPARMVTAAESPRPGPR